MPSADFTLNAFADMTREEFGAKRVYLFHPI